jgi:asparagine synthase (glutamine-hydrolysing)
MCGIVGIVGGQPREDEVSGMLARIRHRGPDGEGIHLAGEVGLGSVRLAIVDPTPTGAQPMRSPDGRYCLVYNGELYNHADFRPALQARGVRFRGHSDTETLLWLLVHEGEAVLPRLNGIFAFAFHDTETRRVLMARDHMGVKPLYYARGRAGRLLFGSEIKTLFATGEVEPRANVDDLVELFMFHFISGERTAFASVKELRPGHLLRCHDGRTTVAEYWNPVTRAGEEGQEPDAGVLSNHLRDAVRRQLMADVPIGVMSSGGLDSGIVTAFAGRADARMQGFCYRDPHYGYDEFNEARAMAGSHGVEVEEVRIDEADVPDLLARLTWYHDEPLPRPHHLAAYAVARQAHQSGLKVLVSGEGGDELFGGYDRYVQLASAVNGGPLPAALVFGHNAVALPRIARFWPRRDFSNAFRFWCAQDTSGFDPINRQLLVDQRTFLQHFLQRSDRMGMAASVEIRVPLLDIPLVEYTNQLPGPAKVSRGLTKRCLRDAARGILPASLVDRPKQGFEMPMAPLLQAGPVAELVDDLLLARPRLADVVDHAGVVGLIRDLRNGQDDLWKVAWLLLTTELWMRTFRVTI